MYELIGRTLGHSYSPGIHQAFGKYEYGLRCLEPEQLGEYILHGQWQGLNVTIPYKKDVMQYLDRIDHSASRIGCVNTILREGDGLIGYNTDYTGFLAMADRAGVDFKDKKVLILGTGATSLTVETAVLDRGAAKVVHTSRRGEPGTVSYEQAREITDIQVIVNATPVGMYPNVADTILELDAFDNLEGVLDVIYNPVRSGLVQQAQARGIPAAGGLYMLVGQAAEACRLWTGEVPDNAEQVFCQLLRDKTNLVLVGMPGSGKTTVATALSELTGRTVVDTDQEIVKKAAMSIPEIFAKYGEAGFRDIETQVLEQVCRESGQIVATGGGAPLREVNRQIIKCNSRVYLIRRDMDSLDRQGRPLSAGADLQQMWNVRRPAYMAVCDAEADNNGTAVDCAGRIWEDYLENIGN